jgi:hypothetical protein
MARGWSLDGRHLNLWAKAGAGSPVQIKQRNSSDERPVLLHHPDTFDSLHRKNDFLAEGVHTVFGKVISLATVNLPRQARARNRRGALLLSSRSLTPRSHPPVPPLGGPR